MASFMFAPGMLDPPALLSSTSVRYTMPGRSIRVRSGRPSEYTVSWMLSGDIVLELPVSSAVISLMAAAIACNSSRFFLTLPPVISAKGFVDEERIRRINAHFVTIPSPRGSSIPERRSSTLLFPED